MNIQEYISSGAIEACILGVADSNEMQVFEQMKQQYSEVSNYAIAFEKKLEFDLLNDPSLPMPNPSVFNNIKNELGFSGKVIPIGKAKNHLKQYAVAASIALLLGSSIFNFMLLGKVKSLQSKVNDLANNTSQAGKTHPGAQFAFLTKPSVKSIAMYGVGSHKICNCTIFWDKETNIGYFVTHHLANMGSNYDYQLWAEVEGKMISLGILKIPSDKSPVLLQNLPENAKRFCVTLEKKGGNETPSNELFLNGQLAT